MSNAEIYENRFHQLAVLFVVCLVLIGAIHPSPSAADMLAIPVISSEDDAEERTITGSIGLTSTDLELPWDNSNIQQVGIRFQNVNVPAGVTITNAYIQFTSARADTGGEVSLTLKGEKADAPLAFRKTKFDISSRARTTAGVSWLPPSWTVANAAGVDQRTPNLSGILQEIIGQPEWVSGNPVAILIEDNDSGSGLVRAARTIDSSLGQAVAPVLHVEFAMQPATGADLSVAKAVDNATPLEGDTVVYTVTLTNNGPDDATGVSLSDVLPAGLTYVNDDAADSVTFYDSGSGEWTVGALGNAASVALQLTATVDAGTSGSTLTNTASVSALDQTDPVSGNDSAAVNVSVAVSVPMGLIRYWKFDEISGSSYTDMVDNNQSAICTACPTPVAGRINGAQQFNGLTDEVNVTDDNSFDWSNGDRFSIEAWIKHDSACSVTGETIIGRRDAVSQLDWSLGCQGSNARFKLIDTAGTGVGADLVGITDIADGEWHHVVAVRDAISGTNLLYVDGVEETSAAVSYAGDFVGSTSLNIGWLNRAGADYHFAGAIDEVAIHDRVLPDSEIRRHYVDGTVGLQRGYWGRCEAPVRIMPLGDSNTARQGFRPGLYFDLLDAGMDVDMVGSQTDSCAPNCSHDSDNEGHSGYTPTDIASNLATWLNLNPPDVVMLHIGTNVDPSFPYPDVTQVGAILDVIKGYDPAVPVVLARSINKARSSYDPQLSVFNQNLESMASARIATGDRILMVDQEPVLDYSGSTTDFPVGDDLHPTGGYDKMVPVWFEGLNRFIPTCNSVMPQVISQPVSVGSSALPYLYMVEATGVPVPSFSLPVAPVGMTIHQDTGRIEWIPPSAGDYDVTVQVSNLLGSSTQSFTIVAN